jgi:hypothetical protein
MRTALCLLTTVLALTAVACGGDDDDGGTATTQTQPTTTTEATPPPTTAEKPSFPETYVFSGDEVLKCLEGKGMTVQREEKPPADDEVGQGIVHDRLLIGSERGAPALRLFMFGAADLAKREGAKVTARAPDARILGTTIFEPIEPDAAKETEAATACLEEQAG